MKDPLSLLRTIGREVLLGAIAEAMRAAHPDHGGDPATAEGRLRDLKDARRAVKELFGMYEKTPETPCINCGGRGSVVGTFGARRCSTCNGTGAAP